MPVLDDIVVVDFSTLLPGPLATLLLAEAGAEVVKIERPGVGDEMRIKKPRWGTNSANFSLLNRAKKSVVIDLKDPNSQRRLRPLLERADLIVEQFRPGVMERLGYGYATISHFNPKVVYCSITGYGQTGPNHDRAGHDLNYVAETGLLALSMGSPQHPVMPPALIADIAGGAYPAVMNILLALRNRDRVGKGCWLDISMTDNLFTLMSWAMAKGIVTDQWPKGGSEGNTGGSPRYCLYTTSDGKVLAVAAIEDRFWSNFCVVIGVDPSFDSGRSPEETIAAIAEIVRGERSEVWNERFEGKDCCCSIVVDLSEAIRSPHVVAREIFSHQVSNELGLRMTALPVPIDRELRKGEAVIRAPSLGQHSAEYLG